MRTLFLLLKVYALELFSINKRIHMPGKKTGRRMTGIAAVLTGFAAVAAVLAFSGFYCYMITGGMKAVGMLKYFPLLLMALLSLMDLITTIVRAPDVLIKTKDFDLVTSLPIPAWVLASSRVLRLYLLNLASNVLIFLPAGVCYAWFARPPFAFYPVFILGMLIGPLLPVAIAAVLGSVVACISALLGNSKYLRLVFTMLLALGTMALSFSISFNTTSDAAVIALITNLNGMITRIWPPAELFGKACTGPDMGAFALFAAISVGAFALFCAAFGKLFLKLNTFTDGRRTRAKKLSASDIARGTHTPFRALFIREVKRYFGCTIYVTNTAFGMVLSTIAVIALSVVGIDRLAVLMELEGFETYIAGVVPFLLAWMVGMSCTTGPSISLEGKTLWIVQSAPVRARDWFMAKLLLSLMITVPLTIVDVTVLVLALNFSPLNAFMCYLAPVSYAIMISLLGLLGNVRFHNLDWSTETVPVKQSVGAMIPVLASMIVSFAPIILMPLLGGRAWTIIPWICIGAALALSALMLLLLRSKAEKWMRAL